MMTKDMRFSFLIKLGIFRKTNKNSILDNGYNYIVYGVFKF